MNTGSILYFFKSAFKSMYKNIVMTLASVFVLIACMLIIGSVYLAAENVLSFMDRLDAQLKKEEATGKARKEAKNKSKDKKN
jgi:cell division protein FtsX